MSGLDLISCRATQGKSDSPVALLIHAGRAPRTGSWCPIIESSEFATAATAVVAVDYVLGYRMIYTGLRNTNKRKYSAKRRTPPSPVPSGTSRGSLNAAVPPVGPEDQLAANDVPGYLFLGVDCPRRKANKDTWLWFRETTSSWFV